MDILVNNNNKNWCRVWLFDDIIFYTHNFFSKREFEGKQLSHNIPVYFIYNKGKLYRNVYINKKWVSDQSLYIHLQKRRMEIETNNKDHYLIVPNKFINTSINEKELLKYSKAPFWDFRYHYTLSKAILKQWILKLSSYISSFQ